MPTALVVGADVYLTHPIGGQGMPVVGKVSKPPVATRSVDLSTASGMLRLERPGMPQPEGFMTWDKAKRSAPQIMLIGPDGKFVAKDLGGP